jgi:hypothetical protein
MLAFPNRTYLYCGECAVCGKRLLSCFPPAAAAVSATSIWGSERIDNRESAVRTISAAVLRAAAGAVTARISSGAHRERASMENCDYGDGIEHARNCT